jgi:predicted HAD superfamily Cof-like phosphohydrolase
MRPNTGLHRKRYKPMEAVAGFHDAFGQKRFSDTFTLTPGLSRLRGETPEHRDLRKLRANLILEEALEACEALGFVPKASVMMREVDGYVYDDLALAKELADVLVVTYGTADVVEVPLEDIFDEVMRSNMSKLGDDGKPVLRSDGKFLKGPNYRPADVHGAITGEWI